MSTLLEDYKSYYEVRMKRYENDSIFQHSYTSEKALYEAMQSCSVLEEFRDKLGNLNFLNAVALIKDKETARAELLEEFDEVIRANVSRNVLSIIETAIDEEDLITKVTETEHQGLIDITLDELNSTIYTDFIPSLERIEMYEKASYPSEYESSRENSLEDEQNKLRSAIQDWIATARSWRSEWQPEFQRVKEARHRRRVSIPDDLLNERLVSLQKYL